MSIDVTEDMILLDGMDVAKIEWLTSTPPSTQEQAFNELMDAIEHWRERHPEGW